MSFIATVEGGLLPLFDIDVGGSVDDQLKFVWLEHFEESDGEYAVDLFSDYLYHILTALNHQVVPQ